VLFKFINPMKITILTNRLLISFGLIAILSSQLSAKLSNRKETLEKVKLAMLCMQRGSWEQGVALQALVEMGDTINLVNMAHEAVLRQKEDGRFSLVASDYNIADPGSNSPGVLMAYKVTGDEKYKTAAQKQYEYYNNPKTRTSKGYILHNTKSIQVWSDNLFMVAPFLAMMGDYDDAIRQIEGMRECLWDNNLKLVRHIWNDSLKIYEDSSYWGGGNGWCAASMTMVVNILPKEREADRKKIIGYVKELIDGCLKYQLSNGLFYDKITEPNFEETNLGQMLAFSIYTGMASGWLDNSYKKAADKMRSAAYTKIDKYGMIQGASSSPRFDRPGTSTECQAFFLMMESAYQKLNNE